MARYPGAIWKPITASKGRQRLTIYNRVNLHVAASEATSLHGYFNQSGIPDSHFYVRRDGTIEQYVDTANRAFADLEGNDATISIETQGMGGGRWTDAQVKALASLYAWAVETHGIKVQIAKDSKIGDSSKGLSWHRLGIDGHFPNGELGGRLQRGGGMHYSKSAGKICPGDDRIRQVDDVFALAKRILAGDEGKPSKPSKPKPSPAPKPSPTPAPKPGRTPSIRPLQRAVRAADDNVWGPDTDKRLNAVREASRFGGSDFPHGVAYTQRVVGVDDDGIWGPRSAAAHDKTVAKIQAALGVTPDGVWGPKTDAAFKALRAKARA